MWQTVVKCDRSLCNDGLADRSVQQTQGVSGRLLRRMPILAHAQHVARSRKADVTTWIDGCMYVRLLHMHTCIYVRPSSRGHRPRAKTGIAGRL